MFHSLLIGEEMSINRRNTLGLMGAALAARKQASRAMGQSFNMPGQSDLRSVMKDDKVLEQIALTNATRKEQERAITLAFENKEMRDELESILFQQYKMVHYLEPDLAYANHSYSMAAKITYQRQRNVNRQMSEALTDHSLWSAIENWKENVFKKNTFLRKLWDAIPTNQQGCSNSAR